MSGTRHAIDTSPFGHKCTCGKEYETKQELLDHVTGGGDDE